MLQKAFLFIAFSIPVLLQANSTVVPYDSATALQNMQSQQNYLLQLQQSQLYQAEQSVLQAQQTQLNLEKGKGLFQFALQLCPALFGGSTSQSTAMGSTGTKLTEAANQMQDIMWAVREKSGFVKEKELDENVAEEVGMDADAQFAKGCDNFINKEGKLGPWGSYTLQQIKDKPDSFGLNVPGDITKWCPKYPKMSKDEREMYWVWIVMSMAASESSCDAKEDNPNAPNGTAIGLLQVWKPVCPKARNLYVAYQNLQCGIDLLAKEMQRRDTLMTPTSKGREGTYWGPLRSDDWNKKRGGDIKGAQRTRGLMSKYRYCK